MRSSSIDETRRASAQDLAFVLLLNRMVAGDVEHRSHRDSAAVEQYTPLLVEARLWAMKARIEPEVNERVLEATRSFLALPAETG